MKRLVVIALIVLAPSLASAQGGYRRIGVTTDQSSWRRYYDDNGNYLDADTPAGVMRALARNLETIQRNGDRQFEISMNQLKLAGQKSQAVAERAEITRAIKVYNTATEADSLSDFKRRLQAAGLTDERGYGPWLFDENGRPINSRFLPASQALTKERDEAAGKLANLAKEESRLDSMAQQVASDISAFDANQRAESIQRQVRTIERQMEQTAQAQRDAEAARNAANDSLRQAIILRFQQLNGGYESHQ